MDVKIIKTVVIGDAQVGKSAIVDTFVDGYYRESYSRGSNFTGKRFEKEGVEYSA